MRYDADLRCQSTTLVSGIGIMIRPHQCPVCDQEFEPAGEQSSSLFPFCSDRCRSIDLLRWSDGRYRIVEDVDPEMAELMRHDPNITVEEESDD